MSWTRVSVVTITMMLGAADAQAGVPIVDGADSVMSGGSLIIIREKYFQSADLSTLGLIDSAAPVDQIAPDPIPWAPSDAVNVQSLLVRLGAHSVITASTATLTFSPGVSVLGVVTDVEGTTGYLWGAWPDDDPNNSQLIRSDGIFGVEANYDDMGWRQYEVHAAASRALDAFSVDRVARTVIVSADAGNGAADDLRVIISYGDQCGPDESFDVTVTEGQGLFVGSQYLGDGLEFVGIPLTEPDPALLSSEPLPDGTLCKTQENVIGLTFDRPISLPAGAPVSIEPLGGGADLGNSFLCSVEPDGVTLKAVEDGQVLADSTWYQVSPTMDFQVQPFSLDLCVLRGDANGSGRVTTSDYSEVKAHLGEYTDARYDLNGTGRVTTADYSVVKAHLGNRTPPKP